MVKMISSEEILLNNEELNDSCLKDADIDQATNQNQVTIY